jgi:SAM-dependent methyltransferase
MALTPEQQLSLRHVLSDKYLVGQGIELGALHNPLWTSERASVRYVDRRDVPGLRRHYPELAALELVPVDIVDDGEKLSSLPDGQLDFIIANHMIEHTENPLGTIRNHLGKIREGGVLYYAVPDKRHTFDVGRPITPFEHVVRDDREGAHLSRMEHFVEWVTLVGKIPPDQVDQHVAKLLEINYSIHFHVWDKLHFRDFLKRANDYLGTPFAVEYYGQTGLEIIAILRKLRPARTTGITPWISTLMKVRNRWFRKAS